MCILQSHVNGFNDREGTLLKDESPKRLPPSLRPGSIQGCRSLEETMKAADEQLWNWRMPRPTFTRRSRR